MPIHTYYCEKCEEEFEAIVKVGAKTSQCQKCKSKAHRTREIEEGGFFMCGTDGRVFGYDRPCFGTRDH